jgi:hypothetical protein
MNHLAPNPPMHSPALGSELPVRMADSSATCRRHGSIFYSVDECIGLLSGTDRETKTTTAHPVESRSQLDFHPGRGSKWIGSPKVAS